MKKILVATAAFLFASGMAFAGSDHFGSDTVPAAGSYPTAHAMVWTKSVDMVATKSIGQSAPASQPTDAGQGIWGH